MPKNAGSQAVRVLFVAAIVAAIAGALDPRFPFGLADYDWAFHLFAFSVLTILGAMVNWPLWAVAIVVGFLGALIELAQELVPSRSASLRDIFLNVAGIGIGLLVILIARMVLPSLSDRFLARLRWRG
jgi:hypothetical protein